MKNFHLLLMMLALTVTACDGWVYVVPTFPAPPPSPTPGIVSPTPVIMTLSPVPSATPSTATPSPSSTAVKTEVTPTIITHTIHPTTTIQAGDPPVQVEVLGCKTSFDITHGMGEVTDAFITLRNESGAPVVDLCATLFALDEGRPHPDKTVCVPLLPNDHMVTLKLTVDSTFQEETPIQVEIKSGERLLSRVGQPACMNIDLAPPSSSTLKTPMPIPQ
jgi:hypothetical protein